ncbi:MAG: hypothetical protein M1834_009641 [Cirrosporium novae-zelandiae]|nr:MAG: hypothetical protein M1834_009641 [Cirrosporium novae-zelandiae]
MTSLSLLTSDSFLHKGAQESLNSLLSLAGNQLPPAISKLTSNVTFTPHSSIDEPFFPCPFKETETAAALKSVEACAAAAIAELRFPEVKSPKVEVDLYRTTCFLASAYLCTIDGMHKGDPNVKHKLKDTDLLAAQSNLYRRLSANLYRTSNKDEYFHLHGSLEATTALNMIGLEGHRPDMTDYHEIIKLIESHVVKFSAKELEKMNEEKRQAGVTAIKWEEFQETDYGKKMLQQPPWTIEQLESTSPPAKFPAVDSQLQTLSGIKVLELCRIIAGPAIGRTLAEYGADVIKVTSPKLSDVPFFQVDGNMGKHTTDLNLRDPENRKKFESLLLSADVILGGYRPQSLERLGYGPKQIIELTRARGKGIVYVEEDCFGLTYGWEGRPGWQQIADCVTGVAWKQGESMGLNEPVIPPFPMSDYGTGCLGTIAALIGLYRRATEGGSYMGRTSIVQYDVFLLRQDLYPQPIIHNLRQKHDPEFYQLRYYDSVDEVGKRARKSMARTHPEFLDEANFGSAWSKGFQAEVKYLKSPVSIEGQKAGFKRSSRPNGFDAPTWEGWEVEDLE